MPGASRCSLCAPAATPRIDLAASALLRREPARVMCLCTPCRAAAFSTPGISGSVQAWLTNLLLTTTLRPRAGEPTRLGLASQRAELRGYTMTPPLRKRWIPGGWIGQRRRVTARRGAGSTTRVCWRRAGGADSPHHTRARARHARTRATRAVELTVRPRGGDRCFICHERWSALSLADREAHVEGCLAAAGDAPAESAESASPFPGPACCAVCGTHVADLNAEARATHEALCLSRYAPGPARRGRRARPARAAGSRGARARRGQGRGDRLAGRGSCGQRGGGGG